MTKALQTWQLDYHTNQGLMVEIVRKNKEIQLHPVAIGLATNRGEERQDKEVIIRKNIWVDFYFLLTIYLKIIYLSLIHI